MHPGDGRKLDLLIAKEDEQMHRRATALRDFYRQHTFTVVPEAEHELWHPNYLQAVKTCLDRLKRQPPKSGSRTINPKV